MVTRPTLSRPPSVSLRPPSRFMGSTPATRRHPSTAHLRQVLEAQHEADRVEDVGLARAVEPRDGIEAGVKVVQRDLLRVGLESIDGDVLDVHGCGGAAPGGEEGGRADVGEGGERRGCVYTAGGEGLSSWAGALHAVPCPPLRPCCRCPRSCGWWWGALPPSLVGGLRAAGVCAGGEQHRRWGCACVGGKEGVCRMTGTVPTLFTTTSSSRVPLQLGLLPLRLFFSLRDSLLRNLN